MSSLKNRLTRHYRRSLSARIITLVLALLLVLQVASFWAIRASLEHHARQTLPKELQTADRVLYDMLGNHARALSESLRTMASDYGFGEALSTNDEATIADMFENHAKRFGATEILLVDLSLVPQAYFGSPQRPLTDMLPAIASRLMSTSPTGQRAAGRATRPIALVEPIVIGRKVLQVAVVSVPQRGWLLAAVPFDQQLVMDVAELTSAKLTILTRESLAAPWQVALTGVGAAQAQTLATAAARWSSSVGGSPMVEVQTPGDTLAVKTHGFGVRSSAGTEVVNGAPLVLALLTSSVDEALSLVQDIQAYLLAITLVGFAAFSVGSVLTARHVTRPLRALAAAAERLGAGDFDTPMPRLGRTDEIGELANSFEQMRHDVADKQAQVEKLAYWDSLTGLPNRVQFSRAVGEAIEAAQATGESVAVLMLDLDRFKHVNDVLGYRLGDLLLIGVADRLKDHCVRGSDLVARLGGDEFAVLLRRGDAEVTEAVAARILQVFQEPMELEEHTVDMHAGIGMAIYPQHATDVENLLSRAEVAMYTAKRRTSGPLMYDASIDASSAQTLSLLSELRHAVDHGELRLFLQPKLGLQDGRIVGAETLVRWMHPVRGMVPPMQFIPFAEQTGFIRHMTMWIFEEAARHWRALHAEGIHLTLSVNLSTRDLLDQDLPQKFGNLLLRHQVPSKAFCLEITESAIMDDPQRALTTLDRLSEQGFLLSIDDFGTGYSSLAYLKRLPVDELKIDKSFVMSMESDLDDRKIVRSTIDLAHNLGMTVVAEGVENAKIWDLLRELNCDHAQGYHMGRPMPATDFGLWAEGWMKRQAPISNLVARGEPLLH